MKKLIAIITLCLAAFAPARADHAPVVYRYEFQDASVYLRDEPCGIKELMDTLSPEDRAGLKGGGITFKDARPAALVCWKVFNGTVAIRDAHGHGGIFPLPEVPKPPTF